ncbi:hypothetical protein MCUN1_000907 [Malassezia cuniculi]|uniref:Tyrosyl-DNA phosphodiesterase 1 n=1 Tax=Malassezia cuniculi TaxID=948313 RepID=A0AAF0EPR7_9BASI|nr:hypothetical protein MCUN1_000907 [Malassezia cuniculi]
MCHIKLIVLYYPDRARVIVSSANLSQLDWTRYDNTFFVQDFKPGAGGEFGVQLRKVYASFGLSTHPAVDMLAMYDLSSAARLVASWPLSPVAKGWQAMEECGLGRLSRVTREMGVGTCSIEAQGSSLAAYDKRWLDQFALVASGASSGALPLPRNEKRASWPDIRILFPTQRWVESESLDGISGGGCFFGRADGFEERGMRHLYAQPESKRGRLFIHAKCLLAHAVHAASEEPGGEAPRKRAKHSHSHDHSTDAYPSATGRPPAGWIYAGSANFTRAAWGTISGTPASPTLSVSNWELGVVVPFNAVLDGSPFDAVPYHRPITPYSATDTPWDVRTVNW